MPDTPPPLLTLGVVVPPSLAPTTVRDLGESLPRRLNERYPGVEWSVSVLAETLDGRAPSELFETARDRLLDEDCDLILVLTDTPLLEGRKPVLSLHSPVHRVGLVALPGFRAGHGRRNVVDTLATLTGTVVGWDEDDDGQDRALSARQMAEDLPLREGENVVQFTGRVLTGNLRVLVGLVVANRPWRLAMTLSRALTAAAAAGVVALATSDLWLLATAYGPIRLATLALLATAAVSLTLIVGAGLWERPRRRAEREQVTLFNLATTASVAIGVVTFFAALFAVSFAAALLLVDQGVFRTVIGREVGLVEYAQLSLLTAALATVGGALGAGLENDDVVHAAAFTRSDD